MKEYEILIGGILHTVQLSDEEAKARGLKAAEAPKNKQAPAVKNKAV